MLLSPCARRHEESQGDRCQNAAEFHFVIVPRARPSIVNLAIGPGRPTGGAVAMAVLYFIAEGLWNDVGNHRKLSRGSVTIAHLAIGAAAGWAAVARVQALDESLARDHPFAGCPV
jgi:hypothetical protein